MRCKAAWLAALLLFLLTALVPSALALNKQDSVGQEVIGNLPLLLRAEGETGVTVGQFSLGGAVADGARLASGADVAIIPLEDLLCNLLVGELTADEIARSVADQELMVVQISPAELKEYLEIGLSHLTLDGTTLTIDYEQSSFSGFPQVAGFTYRGDTSAPAGQRVSRVTLSDGRALDLSDNGETLTLVTTQAMLNGTYGYPEREGQSIGVTEREALAGLVQSGGLSQDYDGADRLTLIGHTGDSLAGKFHLGILAAIAIVVVVVTGRSGTGFLERLAALWEHPQTEAMEPPAQK